MTVIFHPVASCFTGLDLDRFQFQRVCVCVIQKNDLTLQWYPMASSVPRGLGHKLYSGPADCAFYTSVVPILFCCSCKRQLHSLFSNEAKTTVASLILFRNFFFYVV